LSFNQALLVSATKNSKMFSQIFGDIRAELFYLGFGFFILGYAFYNLNIGF
jgi:hypothetical protein